MRNKIFFTKCFSIFCGYCIWMYEKTIVKYYMLVILQILEGSSQSESSKEKNGNGTKLPCFLLLVNRCNLNSLNIRNRVSLHN